MKQPDARRGIVSTMSPEQRRTVIAYSVSARIARQIFKARDPGSPFTEHDLNKACVFASLEAIKLFAKEQLA